MVQIMIWGVPRCLSSVLCFCSPPGSPGWLRGAYYGSHLFQFSPMRRIFRPLLLPHWGQDALPRVVCGYLLTSNFGAAKFGLPWSPPDNNLGLFEVVFWFPQDVAA